MNEKQNHNYFMSNINNYPTPPSSIHHTDEVWKYLDKLKQYISFDSSNSKDIVFKEAFELLVLFAGAFEYLSKVVKMRDEKIAKINSDKDYKLERTLKYES